MNPFSAAKYSFKHYATFYGRASRSSYWNWIAFQALVYAALGLSFLVTGIIATNSAQQNYDYYQSGSDTNWLATGFAGLFMVLLLALAGFFYLACVVPNLATSSRRLHDANFSAWFLLLYLLPYVGTVAIFIMHCFKTYPGISLYENEGKPSGIHSGSSTPDSFQHNSSDW
jgi:uncharacterized membrane protein YhaH (DUF805 family)